MSNEEFRGDVSIHHLPRFLQFKVIPDGGRASIGDFHTDLNPVRDRRQTFYDIMENTEDQTP